MQMKSTIRPIRCLTNSLLSDWEIVRTKRRIGELLSISGSVIVVDFETKGTRWWLPDSKIVGVAISGEISKDAIYIPILDSELNELSEDGILQYTLELLKDKKLVFHNALFDYGWIRHAGLTPEIEWDTMLGWHLINNSVNRSFSLKNAQVEILGWPHSNEDILEESVKERGGSLKNGDHYLGAPEYLALYAALDAYSTWLLYRKQKEECLCPDLMKKFLLPFMQILQEQYEEGMCIDEEKLRLYGDSLKSKLIDLEKRFRCNYQREIQDFEKVLAIELSTRFKSEEKKKAILDGDERPRFNIQSKMQIGRLLKDFLHIEPPDKTETGRPKMDIMNLEYLSPEHKGLQYLIDYSKTVKILQYVEAYLKHTVKGRIHPNYNMCATVSGRLAGFDPNILQVPRDSRECMEAFLPKPGWVLVGGDFTALEPCWTAFYSQDPSLLKIFRDGKGDTYLELVETIYGKGKAKLYDENDIEKSKKALKDERDLCKTVHLAAQYGAWKKKLAHQLRWNINNYTLMICERILLGYWRKFEKVLELRVKLGDWFRKDGYIYNRFGRILRLPGSKDILNRLIQSSGHDTVIYLNNKIDKLRKEVRAEMVPYIADYHDESIWQVKGDRENIEKALWVFRRALHEVNKDLKLGFKLKLKPKVFRNMWEAK